MTRVVVARTQRAFQISRAFWDMGFSTAIAYPTSFLLGALTPLIPVATFFFVAKLVPDSGSVGGDYFSFVIIGFVVVQAYISALGGFTHEMQTAVQQGRFEMLLVEPVRWPLLPFGLALWPVISRLVWVMGGLALSLLLGANFRWDRIDQALGIFVLGLGASLAIGILSGAVGVLTKRSNPVLTIYTLVAGILSGASFPIDLLPAPVRAVSWLIPHTYVINGIRRLVLVQGEAVPGPSVMQAFVALVVFNVLAYPLVLRTYGAIMETGRRTGTLSGY